MDLETNKKYKGSCLCGSIRVEVSGKPKIQFVCYCVDCRKGSGHLGQFIGMYDSKQVKISFQNKSSIKEYIVNFTQSGYPKKKQFCEICGTTILTLPMKYDGNISMVRTTLLEKFDSNFTPEKAIFEDEKKSYLGSCESIYF